MQAPQTDCDGRGIFTCPVGTCYTGQYGWIGCCSVSSCAARTTCIEYNPTSTISCDVNTGGCLSCPSVAPSCVTIQNLDGNQYIEYCGQTNTLIFTYYENYMTTGSMGYAPGQSNSFSFIVSSTTSGSSISSTISAEMIFTTPLSPSLTFTSTSTSTSISQAAFSIIATSSEHSSFQHISTGALVGIIIGSISTVGMLLTFAYCIFNRRYRRIYPLDGQTSSNSDQEKYVNRSTSPQRSDVFGSRFQTLHDVHADLGIPSIAEVDGTGVYHAKIGHPNLWSTDSLTNASPRASRTTANRASAQPCAASMVSPLSPSSQYHFPSNAVHEYIPISPPQQQFSRFGLPIGEEVRQQDYSIVGEEGTSSWRHVTRSPYTTSPATSRVRCNMPDTAPLTSASGMVGYKHLSVEDAMSRGYHEGQDVKDTAHEME